MAMGNPYDLLFTINAPVFVGGFVASPQKNKLKLQNEIVVPTCSNVPAIQLALDFKSLMSTLVPPQVTNH